MDNKSISIIGGGFVGQILKQYYPEAKIWDIKEGEWDSLEEILNCEYIFIAVNFPDNFLEKNNSFDYFISQAKPGRKVIIKSTFVPGSLDWLQENYKNHYWAYNPEFLTERTAWEDFTTPKFQILGLPHQTLPYAQELFSILPDAPVKRIMSPLDAEILKHSINSYYATKVIFFNQLYDICLKLGGDYETIREVMVQYPWIGDSHSQIFHKGYRGFGGKCLPKDTNALQKIGQSELLKVIIELNDRLQHNQKM